MLVKRVPSPIRTGKSLVSMRTVPAGIGLIVAARTPATLLLVQAGRDGLGPVHLDLDHRLAGGQVGGHLAAARDTVHGLDHRVAGVSEIGGGGGLEGDVHG